MKFRLLAALSLFSGLAQAAAPKNIIYVIADGMGPAYTSAYRYYADDPASPGIDATIFDQLLVGMASTYPDDDTIVTDSAAAATALATGTKTYNGSIAVNTEQDALPTLLERAREQQKTTAVVVTSQINHATPASFLTHHQSRRDYDVIADKILDNRIQGKPIADLLLGGGLRYFQRKDRNLMQEFSELGYQVQNDFTQLQSITGLPAIGLFADKGLSYAIDSTHNNQLSLMVDHSLALLQQQNNPNGFVMLVEASQIDWCGHSNDIACAMHEMQALAETLTLIRDFVADHQDTLVVATADHSTGGFTLGANGKYQWRADVVQKVKASAGKIAAQLIDSDDLANDFNQFLDIALNESEVAALKKAQINEKQLAKAVKQIINQRSYSGWTTSGHDAIDVPLMAYGLGREKFVGHFDNTQIAHTLFTFLQ